MYINSKSILSALTLATVIVSTGHAQTLVKPTAMVPPAPPVAGAAVPAPRPPARLIYLSPEFLANPGIIVPPPPPLGSVEAQRDLAAVKAVQAAASPARIALAASDDRIETVWRFSDVLPGFDAAKLPLTDKLFTAARNDQNFEGNVFKPFFSRARPYDVDTSIRTCVPSTYGKAPRSYPSGHATLGYSLGIILAHLIPEKAGVILERARVYGESRVVCGVHFPTDIVASQALGTAVALELIRNPAFKAEFDAAKAELVAAGLTR
jgi:acid phosphatase (class A)